MNFKINALLAVWFSLLIFLVWVLSVYTDWEYEQMIVGATIPAFTLIIQHFFRKKPPKGTE